MRAGCRLSACEQRSVQHHGLVPGAVCVPGRGRAAQVRRDHAALRVHPARHAWRRAWPPVTRPGDSQANFYHNLCDFANLFLSVYVDRTLPGPEAVRRRASRPGAEQRRWKCCTGSRSATIPGAPCCSRSTALSPLTPSARCRAAPSAAHRPAQIRNYHLQTLCFERAVFSIKPRTVGMRAPRAVHRSADQRAAGTFFFNQYVPAGCVAGPASFMRAFSNAAVAHILVCLNTAAACADMTPAGPVRLPQQQRRDGARDHVVALGRHGVHVRHPQGPRSQLKQSISSLAPRC